MRVAADNSRIHASDPSGGVSAFRGGASMDGTENIGIPEDKFAVGGYSGSEIIQSQDFRGNAGSRVNNNDLQSMYDRVMGSASTIKEGKQSPFIKDQQTMSQENAQVTSGTLIHNPTINQQIRNRHIVKN